jgi:GDPmannose 4,6-dehydratase
MKKRALITGITGQDGSYLAELLLAKDYDVFGIIRRHSVSEEQNSRISDLHVNLMYGDLTDPVSLERIVRETQPDEVYNLGAMSQVRISFDTPVFAAQVNAIGVLNILEAIRIGAPQARFYQASSSECFGNNVDEDGYQREGTPMTPVSPYGISKVFGYNMTRHYRAAYQMHASNGSLFNHESPRRGSNFVTQKVVKTAVQIHLERTDHITLGNLDASRDWGHAEDYVRAMWLMLQQDVANDYVIATGKTHTIRDLLKLVFGRFNLDYQDYVRFDPKYIRPEELNCLRGDASKARGKLGWVPEHTYESMIHEMIDAWIKKLT